MRSIFLTIIVAVAAVASAAQGNSQALAVRNYPSDQFSISIPSGWVEIPKAELDQMSKNVQEAAPNAKPQPYNYGFQASAETPYPRVIIQLKTQRWSEDLFAKLPRIETEKEKVQRELNSTSPALAAMKIGTLTWDATARVVWLRMQFAGEDGQEIAGLSGLHPTNVGSIQVNCYAAQAEFERVAPMFSEIIKSVRIDEALKYRERNALAQGLDWLSGSGFSGAIGGLAAVLIVQFFRRRKRDMKVASRSE